MHYDPIKRTLGKVFNQSAWTRKLFYKMLDVLLLRTWHIHRELREWKKGISGDAKILDAGSGFGQYSYFMSRMNARFSILGVDVKDEQVADCNQFFKSIGQNNVRFEVQDLVTFRQENTYDLVLCVDVMEHILEDVDVLTNYYADLKQGGTLIISTPSDQGGSDAHDHDDDSFIEEHVRNGYGKQEMLDKLRKAGFEKARVEYSYGKPGQISWRLSMSIPMRMLNMSKLFFILLPFYYIVVMPFALVLNYMDSHSKHETGTGLIVLAWK